MTSFAIFAITRRQQPDIDAPLFDRADPPHRAIFQHAQQLGLQRTGQFADFVDEQRAAVGHFEQSRLGGHGPGKGPLFVAEQFAFQQRFRQCGTINDHQRLVGSRTLAVQCASNQFLAGAAFALNQDRFVGRAGAIDQSKHFLHRGRLADNFRFDLTCA